MKVLREGDHETLDKIVKRMCEHAPGYAFTSRICGHLVLKNLFLVHSGRRPMIVDMALSVTRTQLIVSVLAQVCPVQPSFIYCEKQQCIAGKQKPMCFAVRLYPWIY